MLISFYAFPSVIDINVVLLQLFQNVDVDRRWVKSDLSPGQLRQGLRLHVEPRV